MCSSQFSLQFSLQTLLSSVVLTGLVFGIFPGSQLSPVQAQEPELEQAAAVVPAELLKKIGSAVPLNPQKTVFLDHPNKCVYLLSTVVLQEGMLEMLCCPQQTKEHESILASDCQAFHVHTGLLALGAKPGRPATFNEVYQPPQGEKLEINLTWKNREGQVKTAEAREWVRTVTRRYFVVPLPHWPENFVLPEDSELKYDTRRRELLHFGILTAEKAEKLQKLNANKDFREAVQSLHKMSQFELLQADWVFVGSQLQKDPQTGQQRYLAEGGDMICVANFPSAMIDVDVRSSAADENRGYEANSDVVPALGTVVLLKLQRASDVEPASVPATEPTK